MIGQNEVNVQSRPKQIPSKFILFITSKAGIRTIISSFIITIVVAVTLSAVLTINDDINELTTDNVSESESQKNWWNPRWESWKWKRL